MCHGHGITYWLSDSSARSLRAAWAARGHTATVYAGVVADARARHCRMGFEQRVYGAGPGIIILWPDHRPESPPILKAKKNYIVASIYELTIS
jgi:hypothetical protein